MKFIFASWISLGHPSEPASSDVGSDQNPNACPSTTSPKKQPFCFSKRDYHQIFW
jgi:hypothetical protein